MVKISLTTVSATAEKGNIMAHMRTATPEQRRAWMELLDQIPRAQVKMLLETKFLAVLTQAYLPEVNMAEFRRVCGFPPE